MRTFFSLFVRVFPNDFRQWNWLKCTGFQAISCVQCNAMQTPHDFFFYFCSYWMEKKSIYSRYGRWTFVVSSLATHSIIPFMIPSWISGFPQICLPLKYPWCIMCVGRNVVAALPLDPKSVQLTTRRRNGWLNIRNTKPASTQSKECQSDAFHNLHVHHLCFHDLYQTQYSCFAHYASTLPPPLAFTQ